MLFNKLFHFVLVVILVLISVASAQSFIKALLIQPGARLCLRLPKRVGIPIAETLDCSVSYCTSPTSVVRYAKIFPDGFIKSAHYAEGPDGRWTQVTGRIDRTKFGLLPTDQGGQLTPFYIHDRKYPDYPTPDSYCVGFGYYVQFVEPKENIYCLRCCDNENDCPTNRGNEGCRAVIPGDYS